MKIITICPILFFAATCLCLAGCPGNLQQIATFDTTANNQPTFASHDVHGRPISVGVPSDNVVALFFNGEDTSDAMQPITAEIAVAFFDVEGLDFVNVVDLRTLAFYEKPFAPNAMREAGQRTIGRINRRLTSEGLPELENLHEHLFLIFDEEGLITDTFDVPDPNQVMTAIIYDRQGIELGRFDLATELDGVLDAIREGVGVTVDVDE